MKRNVPFLNVALVLLAVLAVAVVAGPVLAQHTTSTDKGAEKRGGKPVDSSRDGDHGMMGMRGRGGMMGGMRDGAPGERLLGPEGRLLHDPDRLAEELKLSSEQREKLRNIGDGLARQVIHSRADLEIAQLDLARELGGDASSESEAERQIDTITKLQGDLMKAAVTARFDARAVLTTEQRKELATTHLGLRQDGPGGTRRPGRGRP
jgi:Spy/CpxP family protein refolding chaperone